jgi:ubiquinone/menaquinone biosynthesis C-methylase UbiE
VLDLGAAEGLTLLEMRRLLGTAGQYDGIELSPSLLAAAPPLPSGVRLFEGDVTRLPGDIQGGGYDLVTVLAVLEHLTSPEACLAEAYRALAPGGVIVASCPNPFWDEIAGRLRLVADEHHEQHLDGEAMKHMLRDAGFHSVVYEPFMWAPVGVLPYLRIDVPVARALAIDALVRKIRRSGFSFVNQLVAAKKPLR